MNTKKDKGKILAETIESIATGIGACPVQRSLRQALAEYQRPWTLGQSVNGFTLGPGQQWHRQDGWTEEMLPDGYRPHILGEKNEGQDEYFYDGVWNKMGLSQTGTVKFDDHIRTRRPLPPAVEWADEKQAFREGKKIEWQFSRTPFPEEWHLCHEKDLWKDDFNYRVKPIDPYAELKKAHAEGKTIQIFMDKKNAWEDLNHKPIWGDPVDTYRVKPSPVLVPLGPEDVPPGSAIRFDGWKSSHWVSVSGISDRFVEYLERSGSETVGFQTLQKEWTINRNDGRGFVRCEKEAK